MRRQFSELVDECLGAVLSGEATLEECLDRYPEQSADLRPLLEVANSVRQAHVPGCDPAAFAAGKRRMLEALSARREPARQSGPRAAVLQRAFAASAAVLLVAAGLLLIPRWPGTRVGQQATLANVDGLVEVLCAGGDSWRQALVGEQFESGDRIRTTVSASAVVAFFDGSATWLEPGTELTLTDMRSRRDGGAITTALFQWSGATFSSVQPLPDAHSRFEIETAAALVAARGTRFAVRVDESGATHVAVAEGVVGVTAGPATVEVRQLEETDIEPEQAPAPARPATEPLPTPSLTLPEELPQPPTPTAAPAPPSPTAAPGRQEATATPDLTLDRTPQPVDLGGTPEAQPADAAPEPEATLVPLERTRTPGPTAEPIASLSPAETPAPEPSPTHVPPGQTKTPPGQNKTPEPAETPALEPSPTHVPPGQTKTPPGQDKTPEPTKTPK